MLQLKIIIISLISLLVCQLSLAEETVKVDKTKSSKVTSAKKSVKSEAPSKIIAKNFRMGNQNGLKIVTFSGNVQVFDKDSILKADKIIVFFDKNNDPTKILCFGRPTKPVEITQNKEKALGRRASYDFATNTIIIEGEPEIHYGNGSRLINAKRIIVDRNENAKIPFEADGGNPLLLSDDIDELKSKDPDKQKEDQ